MTSIQEYIKSELEERRADEVADRLGISVPMISSYKTQGYNPSIRVAMKVYMLDNVVLLPFSKEGLEHEIKKS